MVIPSGDFLELAGLLQDEISFFCRGLVFLLWGRWSGEVIPCTCCWIHLHRLLWAVIPFGNLFELLGLCEDKFSFLGISIDLWSRWTSEVVAARRESIRYNWLLWVMIPLGHFLEFLCFRENKITLSHIIFLLIFRSRWTTEIIAATSKAIGYNGLFGMQIPVGKLFHLHSL